MFGKSVTNAGTELLSRGFEDIFYVPMTRQPLSDEVIRLRLSSLSFKFHLPVQSEQNVVVDGSA